MEAVNRLWGGSRGRGTGLGGGGVVGGGGGGELYDSTTG